MEEIRLDNRQRMMRIREIDLLELLTVILLHWRSMIVALLCGAILLGGMSYVKSTQNIQKQQAQIQQEEKYVLELDGKTDAERRELFASKLTDEELTDVESAYLYEQQYAAKEKYMENSVFMNADSFHMYIADLIYRVDAEDMEQVYSINEIYKNLLKSGELRSRLAAACNNSIDTVISIADDTIDLHNSSVLRMQLEYSDEETCRSLAQTVRDYIVEKQGEIMSSVGEHEINLIEESYAERMDSDLLDRQKNLKSELINLRTSEIKLTKEFSSDQQEYFELLCMQERESEENTTEEENAAEQQTTITGKASVSKTYLLMGAVLFVFVYAGVLCLKCVANNKLRAKDDLQDLFGIPQLGLITKEKGKKKAFSFVDEWILKMYYHNRRRFDKAEAVELAVVAVHMAAEKNTLDTIYLVGTGMGQSTKQICETLQKELQKSKIEVVVAENILYNAENLKKLENAQGAVLIETVGQTMYTEILQELQLLDRQQITILGGITVEE